MIPPISLEDTRRLVDTGMISDTPKSIEYRLIQRRAGEIFDVYCVAMGVKPLAALDFTGTGRKYLKGLDIKFINQLIDYCNHCGVQYYHMIKRGGMYIKSIFFLPDNRQKARNLMYNFWTTDYTKITGGIALTQQLFHWFVGHSLGYTDENIDKFLTRLGFQAVADENRQKYLELWENCLVTEDDLKTLEHSVVLRKTMKHIRE